MNNPIIHIDLSDLPPDAGMIRVSVAVCNAKERLGTSPHFLATTKTGVGLGWRTSLDVGGRTVIEHAGSMEGARTVLSMFPSQQVVVALMTNGEWSSTDVPPENDGSQN